MFTHISGTSFVVYSEAFTDMKKTGLALLALTLLVCSCSKTSDTRMAKIKFINAYPSSTYRFAANDKDLTPGLIQSNQGSDLIEILNGTVRIKGFDKRNSAVIDTSIKLAPFKNYTMIGYDARYNTLKSSLIEDDLTAPASGKAHVRVVYAFVGGDTLRVNTRLRSANDFWETTGRAFSDHDYDARYRAFKAVAAPGTYQFTVTANKSTNDMVINEPLVNLASGKIYTLLVNADMSGGRSSNGVPFYTLSIIQHN